MKPDLWISNVKTHYPIFVLTDAHFSNINYEFVSKSYHLFYVPSCDRCSRNLWWLRLVQFYRFEPGEPLHKAVSINDDFFRRRVCLIMKMEATIIVD